MSPGTGAHSAAGGQGDKHHERAWPAAAGTQGPTSGPGPMLSLPSWLSHRLDKLQEAFTPVRGVDSSERSFLFSDSEPPSPDPAAHSSTTHDTRPGRNGRRECFPLRSGTSREAVKGVSFQRKRVRNQKHPAARDKRLMRFPTDILSFLRRPACLGFVPHILPSSGLTRCRGLRAVLRPRVFASGPC